MLNTILVEAARLWLPELLGPAPARAVGSGPTGSLASVAVLQLREHANPDDAEAELYTFKILCIQSETVKHRIFAT